MGTAGETGPRRNFWRYYARAASPEIADNILREIERVAEAIGRDQLGRPALQEPLCGSQVLAACEGEVRLIVA